jgi:hypothetical protein
VGLLLLPGRAVPSGSPGPGDTGASEQSISPGTATDTANPNTAFLDDSSFLEGMHYFFHGLALLEETARGYMSQLCVSTVQTD